MKTGNTNAATDGERLLTPKQLCERLQVSRVTGWKLTSERNLKYIRIGRSVRIRESDLQAWLEKQTVNHTGEEKKVTQ